MAVKDFERCFYQRQKEWLTALKTVLIAVPTFCTKMPTLTIVQESPEREIH